MTAASLVRQARRRAGLSQRALAERTGIHQPEITRIETGKTDPRVGTLFRLLKACGERLETAPRLGIGIDRTMIHELRKLTPRQRLDHAVRSSRNLDELLKATRR